MAKVRFEPGNLAPESFLLLLAFLLYDMMFDSIEGILKAFLNEWCRPHSCWDHSQWGRTKAEEGFTGQEQCPSLRPADPAGQVLSLLEERERMAPVPGPSRPHDYLPMFFFKAKRLGCQELVCLSPGDRGCQAQREQ